MKTFERVRRVRSTAYLVGFATLCSSGCTTGSPSLASLNPFSKSDSVAAAPPATSSSNGFTTAASGAWAKTKAGVSGVFGKTEPTTDQTGKKLADDDPTRLSSPATVSADVFVAQGALWETTGDFAKAMDSYNRALQTEPNHAGALASVARLHMRQEQFPLAAEAFRKALAVTPADAGLLNDYGMTRAKMGDLAGATQSINQALQAAPGTSRFANNLANVRYDAGDAEGALGVLMQHNKPAVAHFNMAYLHYRGGNHAQAKLQLDQVMQYEPLAERDSAVAQAVLRSRDMLAQIDGEETRIAQAAPRPTTGAGPVVPSSNPVMPSGNPVVTTFHSPAPGQQTAQVQATTAPGYGAMPMGGPAMSLPAQVPMAMPQAAQPAMNPAVTSAGSTGPFELPQGVFNQPIR